MQHGLERKWRLPASNGKFPRKIATFVKPRNVVGNNLQPLSQLMTKEDFEKEELPIFQDLRTVGIVVGSVWDLVNNRPHEFLERNFTGRYDIAYQF